MKKRKLNKHKDTGTHKKPKCSAREVEDKGTKKRKRDKKQRYYNAQESPVNCKSSR